MSKAELVLVNESGNCTLYTIQFTSDDQSEFEKFYKKFKDDLDLNEDLMRIISVLSKIIDFGALERYFRPEGKIKDNVVALPVVKSKLRLYGLRLSDKILILGNGGVKNTRSYNEDEELKGYVITLQNFDKLIKEGIKQGNVKVMEKQLDINKPIDI